MLDFWQKWVDRANVITAPRKVITLGDHPLQQVIAPTGNGIVFSVGKWLKPYQCWILGKIEWCRNNEIARNVKNVITNMEIDHQVFPATSPTAHFVRLPAVQRNATLDAVEPC